MHKFLALSAVAGADVARTVWVLDAVLASGASSAIDRWLAAGLILATGGLSLAMIGFVVRAMLEQQHAIPVRRPSS